MRSTFRIAMLIVAGLTAGGCGVAMLRPSDVVLYGESLDHGGTVQPCTERNPDELCGLEQRWSSCKPDCAERRADVVNALRRRWNECKSEERQNRREDALLPHPEAEELRTRNCDGIRNRLYLIEQYAREWEYKRTPATQLPFAHGLAISGGGLRSAAFAIGVMSGLQEIGVMDGTGAFPAIDAVSSVSGGSYAAGWYYVQQLRCEEKRSATRARSFEAVRRAVLDRCGAFEDRLASTADVEPQSRLVALGVADTLLSPVNLLVNGVFGWHSNTTPAQWDYERRLANRFNTVPPAACPDAPNAFAPTRTVTFAELRAVARREHLPYLIVNSTAYVEDDTQHQGALLANGVYELGLERSGSQGFGWFGTPDISMREAVAISGAAADSSLAPGSGAKILFSSLNHDLGVYIDNPRYDPEKVRVACEATAEPVECRRELGLSAPWYTRLFRRVAFFPLYLINSLSLYRKDAEGARIYLTDGGHSENLGAFSLARRLPGRLTIVDGEWDPTFAYESYHALKRALRAELGAELAVPGIDNPDEPDAQSAYTNAYPVMDGWLGTFWIRDGAGLHPVTIPVKYIKLSMDTRNLAAYWGTWFKSYYEQQGFGHPDGPPPDLKHPCTGVANINCPFPQQWTFDMEFDEAQFRAYRDLGRWIVVHYYDKGDSGTTGTRRPLGFR